MTPTNPQSPFRFFVDLFAHKAQDREILTPTGEAADDKQGDDEQGFGKLDEAFYWGWSKTTFL